MKKHLAIIALLACPSLAMADNYATCLLDKLPGIQNDNAATAAWNLCGTRHPGGLESVDAGSGRGLFSYESGAECALEESGQTRSNTAAYQIRLACDRLYNEPNFFDQFDQPKK